MFLAGFPALVRLLTANLAVAQLIAAPLVTIQPEQKPLGFLFFANREFADGVASYCAASHKSEVSNE